MVPLYYSCSAPAASSLISTKPEVSMGSAELSVSSQDMQKKTYVHLTVVTGYDFGYVKCGSVYLLYAR